MSDEPQSAQGVEHFIQQLRDKGVEAGQREADRLVDEARKMALEIVQKANGEADEMKAKIKKDIEQDKAAAEAALKLAFRDTVLRLKSEITSRFAAQVQNLVSVTMHDRESLRVLILEVVREILTKDIENQPIEILISPEIIRGTEFSENPEDPQADPLSTLIQQLSSEMLRQEIEIKAGGDHTEGIRIRLIDKDLEIELTEQTISDLLLKHILPRFRARLEGMVR
jgi:V/A-type H+/Na+-transporting ATPase subunit E